jgi:hypothetical protein
MDIMTEGLNMQSALKFFWNASRGNRLRPWRSAYIRWRIETYTGKKADTVGAGDLFSLILSDKRQFLRFLLWTGEISGYAEGSKRS